MHMEEFKDHWDIMFEIDDLSFSFMLDLDTNTIDSFSHQWVDYDRMCPFCGNETGIQCSAVLTQTSMIQQLVRETLQHPSIRLRLLTETNVDFDDIRLRMMNPVYEWIETEELKKKLTFFKAEAEKRQQHLLYIESDLAFAVISEWNDSKTHVRTINQQGKLGELPLKKVTNSPRFLSNEFIDPYLAILTREREIFLIQATKSFER